MRNMWTLSPLTKSYQYRSIKCPNYKNIIPITTIHGWVNLFTSCQLRHQFNLTRPIPLKFIPAEIHSIDGFVSIFTFAWHHTIKPIVVQEKVIWIPMKIFVRHFSKIYKLHVLTTYYNLDTFVTLDSGFNSNPLVFRWKPIGNPPFLQNNHAYDAAWARAQTLGQRQVSALGMGQGGETSAREEGCMAPVGPMGPPR